MLDDSASEGDADGDDGRGLSDRDEQYGAERDNALSSPAKPAKVRATSTSLVTTKCEGRQEQPTNSVLPRQVFYRNAWRLLYLPTLYQWAGASEDPFRLNITLLAEAILSISCAIYGDDVDLMACGMHSQNAISTINSGILKLIMQRLQEWRGGFSSVAIAVLTAYFEDKEHEGKFDTNAACKAFATYQLDNYRFLYEDVQGTDPKAFHGKFNGPFLGPVLAHHINSIAGACHVHGLYSDEVPFPCGALAVAMASVKRALTLWKDENISVECIEKSQEPNSKLRLMGVKNKKTGKLSTRGLAFSDVNWGETVRWWAANMQHTKPRHLKTILENAESFAKISVLEPNASTGSSFQSNMPTLLSESDDEDEE